jgi:hypothetical protein
MHDAIEQGYIGSQIMPHVEMGELRNLCLSGIGHDELAPVGQGPEEALGSDGVSLGRVGTNDQDAPGILQLSKGVGHGPASKGSGQPGHCGGVSETGAMVYMVVAEHSSGEFLINISLFIDATG